MNAQPTLADTKIFCNIRQNKLIYVSVVNDKMMKQNKTNLLSNETCDSSVNEIEKRRLKQLLDEKEEHEQFLTLTWYSLTQPFLNSLNFIDLCMQLVYRLSTN